MLPSATPNPLSTHFIDRSRRAGSRVNEWGHTMVQVDTKITSLDNKHRNVGIVCKSIAPNVRE
jgi:hypothetical protein